jgi:hypothetical protein
MKAGRIGIIGTMLAVSFVACAKRDVTMDVQGAVMYEKPQIEEISHEVADSRREGGTVMVTVRLTGDPGLAASFDIRPNIADHEPLRETEEGSYVGSFSFSPDAVGGPFTIIGRLWHDKAGEIVLRDPNPLTISLIR